jgi:hypothetical protein
MIDHNPSLFMSNEKDAEALLQSLTSQPGQLTVKPEGKPEYSIPLARQDFDFAYAGFAECLAGLKTS